MSGTERTMQTTEQSLEQQLKCLPKVWSTYIKDGSGKNLTGPERAFVYNQAKHYIGSGESGKLPAEGIISHTGMSSLDVMANYGRINHLSHQRQSGLDARAQHVADLATGRKQMRGKN